MSFLDRFKTSTNNFGIIDTNSLKGDFDPLSSSSKIENQNCKKWYQKYQKYGFEGEKGIFGIIGDAFSKLDSGKMAPQVPPVESVPPLVEDSKIALAPPPEPSTLPKWIRAHVPGEPLDDTKERRCVSARCGAVLMRQEESDTSWSYKRYCCAACYSGQPSIPVEVVNENSH